MPVSVGRIRVLGKPEDGTHCGETSITSSFVNEASDTKMIRINKLVRRAHEVSATPVSHRPLSDSVFVTFHDAGLVVRRDGKSQAVFALARAERAILEGARSPTSRSSLECEVQTGNMADEETTFVRLACQEMINGSIQLRNTKEALAAYYCLPRDGLQGTLRLCAGPTLPRNARKPGRERERDPGRRCCARHCPHAVRERLRARGTRRAVYTCAFVGVFNGITDPALSHSHCGS